MITWLKKLFKSTDIIPKGMYCYSRDKVSGKCKVCPYWKLRKDKPYQDNGYCGFLGKGDWESEGFGVLWDLCKDCSVKVDYYEE